MFSQRMQGKNKCVDIIESKASQVLGKKMVKDRTECIYNHKTNICNLKLVEEEVLSVTTGVARMSNMKGRFVGIITLL